MNNIAVVAFILFRETTREPGWLFWSLFFPLILITAIFLQSSIIADESLYFIFLSYVSVVTSIRGTGAYLLGRRESGFLKAFVSFETAQRRYLVAQCLAGFLFAAIVTIFFGFLSSFYFNNVSFEEVLLSIYRACILSFFIGLCSSVINIVPFKFQTVYGVMTAAFAPMLLLSMAHHSEFYTGFVLIVFNAINPVYLGYLLIKDGVFNHFLFMIILLFLTFIAIMVTMKFFKIETYWDK